MIERRRRVWGALRFALSVGVLAGALAVPGSVATPGTTQCVGSTEFIVLRPLTDTISPEFLMVFLRSPAVQTVLKWCQDGSNHPRFKEDELLTLDLPDRILSAHDRIKQLVLQAIQSHRQATTLLEQAKQQVEQMVLGSE